MTTTLSPSSCPAVEISSVSKTFGDKTAVSNLDLVIPSSSLCGFIGPNGAGKTTTIRMIMSIIFPDRGRIRVLGKDSALESKDRIGYLPEERGVYRKMRVASFLAYIARLKGIDAPAARKRVAAWLERVGLSDCARKRCEELSKGMQQKIQFIAAVIHEPDLLILDEVFSGLDPVNRKLMRQLIHEQYVGLSGSGDGGIGSRPQGPGRTIIFSTHAMYEAEQLCDRIFMIHRGQKMLDGSLDQIHAHYPSRTLIVEPEFGLDDSANAHIRAQSQISLADLPGVHRVLIERDGLHVLMREDFSEPLTNPALMRRVIDALSPMTAIRRLEVKRISLEEIFIRLVESTGENLTPDQLASPDDSNVPTPPMTAAQGAES